MSVKWADTNGLLALDLFRRSAPDLQVEYTYLLHGLVTVSQKANEILRRIPPLEQYLTYDSHPTKEKRKIRKQLGWLKCRLAEASRQEQTIHQRLGQLAWEIQQRQRVILLDEERRIYAQQSFSSSSTSSKTAYPQLDPTAAEFVPTSHFWTPPGMQSLYIPEQAYTPRTTFYSGIDDIIMKDTGIEIISPTLHIEDIDHKIVGTGIPHSGTESAVVDNASQTSTSVNGFDRIPFIIHRSSSTSDLTGSFSSDRRNSLPSPTDLENFVGLGCDKS